MPPHPKTTHKTTAIKSSKRWKTGGVGVLALILGGFLAGAGILLGLRAKKSSRKPARVKTPSGWTTPTSGGVHGSWDNYGSPYDARGIKAFNKTNFGPSSTAAEMVAFGFPEESGAARGGAEIGEVLSHADLNAAQLSNLARYTKKLPSGAEPPVITRGAHGAVHLSSRVPCRVPQSYATYDKVVDHLGKTIKYTKTTIAPDGKIVHVKDKLR